ncbi:RNase A-like domain-containing protein [Actinomycetospora flava]|uniref:RNase A-like domain-containing protein n=1 Tax=Actinomycetospora flava TaxID=3129232 RepID=A0ABU8M227_9PSEU
MPGLPGDPAAVEAAADALERAAQDVAAAGEGVAGHGRTATAAWSGTAAMLAATNVGAAAAGMRTTADAARAAAGPLRVFAAELRRVQQDWLEGERMATQGAALLVGVGSGAPADAARESGRLAYQDGTAIMLSAEDRARSAAEDAARALDAAGAGLAGLLPAPAAPPDGNLWDGLVKAGGDVVDEVTDTVGGVVDHVNVFDDDFGDTWARTWETTRAAVSDPLGAVGSMAQGTVQPVVDSYQSGGLDEAIGRSPGVIAAALGGKGITKLGRLGDLAPDRNPGGDTSVAPGGWLQQHQDAGGHVLDPDRRHIGAKNEQLVERQRNADRPIAVSTFTDLDVAERSIHANLTANRAAIEQWLQTNPTRPEGFNLPHHEVIGRHLPKNASGVDAVVPATVSRVIIRPDTSMPDGYHIVTAYLEP